jgi:hypothetical protein
MPRPASQRVARVKCSAPARLLSQAGTMTKFFTAVGNRNFRAAIAIMQGSDEEYLGKQTTPIAKVPARPVPSELLPEVTSERVEIFEVGPRDGERQPIRSCCAGTSFCRPKMR